MHPSNILVALAAPFLSLTQAAALHPTSHIEVHLYGDYGKHYVEKVWPDGDEHWFSKSPIPFFPCHTPPIAGFVSQCSMYLRSRVSDEGEDKWKKEIEVKFIKYYTKKEESGIRCLPTESYYPWNPIKVSKFFQLPDEHGLKVYGLYLEKSQPIEVLRCDLP